MPTLNATHDPRLTSWVASANGGQTDFPIQNLPFAVFRRLGSSEAWRGGVAIGDQIVDMAAAVAAGVFSGAAEAPARAAAQSTLNDLMQMGPQPSSDLRQALSKTLQTGSAQEIALRACLVPQAEAEYRVPARIGDYTDFYTSVHHATNIGKQFRPDNPLLPNYKWVPIGYHGRASTINVSGTDFPRPKGQHRGADGARVAADGGILGQDQAPFGGLSLQPVEVGGMLVVQVVMTDDNFANFSKCIGHLVPAQSAVREKAIARSAHAARRLAFRTTSSITDASWS